MGAVVALAAIGGGCRDGDDKLSAEDYYKQLETISQDVDKKIEANNARTPVSEEPAAQKDFLVKLLEDNVGLVEDATKKIEALKPPDDVKPKHDTFVAAIKAQTAAVKDVRDTVKDTAPEQVEPLLPTLDLADGRAAADAACTALQDDAKSKNVTVELKCGD